MLWVVCMLCLSLSVRVSVIVCDRVRVLFCFSSNKVEVIGKESTREWSCDCVYAEDGQESSQEVRAISIRTVKGGNLFGPGRSFSRVG